MADAVTSQTLTDTTRRAVMKFTNLSDGSGEASVTKVDVSALAADPVTGAACTGVVIEHMYYDVRGLEVHLLWDATTDVPIWYATTGNTGDYDFTKFGGLTNNAGSGKTGNINFLTTAAASTAGDTYTIVLSMLKSYG